MGAPGETGICTTALKLTTVAELVLQRSTRREYAAVYQAVLQAESQPIEAVKQTSVSKGMLICMRTTLNLPEGLVAQAKARAAESGRTFTSLVEEGLRLVLEQHDIPVTPEPLPAYGQPEARILVDLADRDALWATLDEDRPA